MKLASIFTSSMVFQADRPIRVFGEGEGTITVQFLDRKLSTEAKDGKWMVVFDPRPYGGPYDMSVTDGKEKIVLRDIMIGEVILFAGQSNVQFRMAEEKTPAGEYVDDDLLRIFVCGRMQPGEPIHPEDGWVKCRRYNVRNWSALAYLVGREARRAKVPSVGVIACSQGASIIQSWIDETVLHGSPLDLPPEMLHRDWRDTEKNGIWNPPGTLYHYMLEPLTPYSIGSVVWYQGESNTSMAEAEIYDKLLGMMIANWRKAFDCAALPFAVVQIADYTLFRDQQAWKRVQKAQADAEFKIWGVRTVVSADVCENNMIHPVTKSKLAQRIYETLHEMRAL